MALCRTLLFTLHESARYLSAHDEPARAVLSLDAISLINHKIHADGSRSKTGAGATVWSRKDVVDRAVGMRRRADGDEEPTGERSPIVQDEDADEEREYLVATDRRVRSHEQKRGEGRLDGYWERMGVLLGMDGQSRTQGKARLRRSRRMRRTTVLLWSLWGVVSAAYTVRLLNLGAIVSCATDVGECEQIFNVFLPKWIEVKLGNSPTTGDPLLKSLQECGLGLNPSSGRSVPELTDHALPRIVLLYACELCIVPIGS